jgi:isoleucyl-tRNA synthetase
LVTFCKIIAPVTPFIAEEIFRNLTDKESVHLELWPEVEKGMIDYALEEEMGHAQNLASEINAFRKKSGVKVKIPFKKLSYKGYRLSSEVLGIVRSEVNVEELVHIGEDEEFIIEGDTGVSNQNIEAGEARDIIRSIQQKRKELGTSMTQMVAVTLPSWPEGFEEEIKRKALISKLTTGDFKVVAL